MAANRVNDLNEPPAPPELVAALRRTQSKSVFVPRTVDETILSAVRQHFVPVHQQNRPSLGDWLRWPAIATASIMVCVLVYQTTQPLLRPRPASYARQDLNRDGNVDILDAFQIARELLTGTKPPTEFDVNGDGVVDRRDVEALAARAVKLEKGGRS